MTYNNGEVNSGIVTIALGSEKYLAMALDLARSLDRHCPTLPRAIVTEPDRRDPRLERWFHHRVAADPSFSDGFHHKLNLAAYAPFSQTLYIDCDCLVFRDLDFAFRGYRGTPVGIEGRRINRGHWYAELPGILEKADLPYLYGFNSGAIYIEPGNAADAVFGEARAYAERYEEFGFEKLSGKYRSDEPVLGLSLALHGIKPPNLERCVMSTATGLSSVLRVDVLAGRARFARAGQVVEPAIVHFAGYYQRHPAYRRERKRLRHAAEEVGPVKGLKNAAAWSEYAVMSVMKPTQRAIRRRLGLLPPARPTRWGATYEEMPSPAAGS